VAPTKVADRAPVARVAPASVTRTSAGHARGAARERRPPAPAGFLVGVDPQLNAASNTLPTTPPLAVALDAAGLHGDPAKPLPPTPALVGCCWLGSGGTRCLAYINARQTTAGAPRLPLCG